MNQAERDRLVTLKKANKKLITQREAAEELGISERQICRLLKAFKRGGDKVVIHACAAVPQTARSRRQRNRRRSDILSQDVYRGFGPTLATEYLENKHEVRVSRETVRKWMIRAKLWKAQAQHVEKVFEWRQRRSRLGELLQWDTRDHGLLEGRGEEI